MEEESLHRGAVLHLSSEDDGRRLCITGMSLVDPAHVPGERVVNVWAEVGQEKRVIGTLSSNEPVVTVTVPVVLRGEFVLRYDLAVPAAIRLNVRVLGPPASSDIVEVEGFIVLGEDVDDDDEEAAAAAAEEEEVQVEYEPLSEEDIAERYDSDNGEDVGVVSRAARETESRQRGSIPPAWSVVPDGEFIGPARFTVVGNTAGFMRVAAAEATDGGGQETKEILVLYRYTRFSRSRTRCGGRGVEACRRTKTHRLHFAVPPAGDWASSLACAGSSLAPLIYPGLFRWQLTELWTSLLMLAAATNGNLPQAGRLQVIMEVGILRREDYTVERMEHLRCAMVNHILEPWWPAYYHVSMELHLPEPVTVNRWVTDDDDEEECCLCLELLESGLAAWPGCGHVFHGACVEKTLQRSQMCPLCRHRLSDPFVQKNDVKTGPRCAVR